MKKIIEDCSSSEETIKLLRFCCWENPQFSSTVLSELLWQVKMRKEMCVIQDFRVYIYRDVMLNTEWVLDKST